MTNTRELDLNIETLTLGEAEKLEDMLGLPLSKLADASQVKLIRSLATLVAQRDDADFTYEDTADMLLSDMAAKLGEGDEDPT